MKNKYSLQLYLDTLQLKINDVTGLIDIDKIIKHMREVESDLNTLNYLICNDINEFKDRVRYLYTKNKDCFKSIFILFAIRKDETFYSANQ